ncbi:hypothetical protein CAPTEDRAFT_196707 [Capitella teleta]|uniref:Carboxypeptidase n=1 Tax=Capitella teleta TaxID=283909 RepID=R7U402_CAPTE|nr:hypothetical protein CAPTEDRAFT_196707 [Capitella teleta]|eukprot:ELT98396.1 hypothetical protein CAPTEDRAFT_196707 [Capitella teleta]
MRLLLLTLLFSPAVFAAKDEDEVTHLPHLIGDQPEFKHYAGYLDAGDGKQFFYWFVESERDPANDPMVLWLNGGPGCSSLTGFLVEQGPWRATPDGENLVWFEDRWNKIANIIFMESPQCVGFSYSEDGECVSSDDQTAADNHAALIDFFNHWPEYADNDFFVTGESYAGVYVPTLSVLLMNDPQFNFKGMAVGNGVTNRQTMFNGFTYFAWARGLFGSE